MNKSILVIIMSLLIAGSALTQDKQNWKFVHPLPQPNNLRKIKAVDANNWVAVGANGTFMRSTNAGASWYFQHFVGKINAALGTTMNYDLWFFNANTGIVVGDQGYIGRTTDGGLNFDSVGIGLVPSNSRCYSVWFADANTGYIGAGSQTAFTSQILKTTNGGVNWSLVYSSSTGYITALGGIDAQNVIASWYTGTQVKTTNGGANWTETTGGIMPYVYNISFLNTTTGFAAGGYGKAVRTTNAGASWDSIFTPATTNQWSIFQIKTVSATEIYAVGDPGFLYMSSNMGNSWASLPLNVPNVYPYIWYSIDKVGSNLIISGDYGLVAKSTNGGTIWSSNNTQYNTQIMNDIQSLPGTSKIWFAGRPNTLGHQILYSSNFGGSWTTYGTGGAEEFFAISMIDQNTGYASCNNSKVFKTTNGGQNWVAKTQPSGSNYSLYSMDFLNENTGYVCVNYTTVAAGNVFKTTDGGNSWTQYTLAATNPGSIMSCDFVDANTGFVSLNSSNKPVYKTTDGGVTWTPYTTGMTGSIYEVKAVNANVIYAVSNAGTYRVAKSTDGGLNWTGIVVPVAADYRGIDFKDANTGYICGNGTTVVSKTTDGGATWTFQNTHTVTLLKVHVTPGDTAFATGGITSILRNSAGNITGVKFTGKNVPDGYFLQQNYPNPFNPVTTIEFALPKSGLVSVKVFDIAGREYFTDVRNLTLNPGSFKMSFDGSELSSGIYFYSLNVDGVSVMTKKMLMIK
jgi:photosystem II stability/assembly factor-like uncharacterized protein